MQSSDLRQRYSNKQQSKFGSISGSEIDEDIFYVYPG